MNNTRFEIIERMASLVGKNIIYDNNLYKVVNSSSLYLYITSYKCDKIKSFNYANDTNHTNTLYKHYTNELQEHISSKILIKNINNKYEVVDNLYINEVYFIFNYYGEIQTYDYNDFSDFKNDSFCFENYKIVFMDALKKINDCSDNNGKKVIAKDFLKTEHSLNFNLIFQICKEENDFEQYYYSGIYDFFVLPEWDKILMYENEQ